MILWEICESEGGQKADLKSFLAIVKVVVALYLTRSGLGQILTSKTPWTHWDPCMVSLLPNSHVEGGEAASVLP